MRKCCRLVDTPQNCNTETSAAGQGMFRRLGGCPALRIQAGKGTAKTTETQTRFRSQFQEGNMTQTVYNQTGKIVRKSILGQADKKYKVPKEEKGVWGSQGGEKDKLFLPIFLHLTHMISHFFPLIPELMSTLQTALTINNSCDIDVVQIFMDRRM